MNIQINLLDYAAELERAGIPRAHAEAIAQLQARAIKDLIDHELVTKDFMRAELAVIRSEFKAELAVLKAELRDEFRSGLDGLRVELRKDMDGLRVEFRKDMDSLRVEFRKDMDDLKLQLRALQFGGAIAAFALGAIVLLSRLIN